VFLLEIAEYAKGDQSNHENIATLKLPATTEMITKALKQIDENSLQECIFYECKSMIPQLNHLCGDRTDFENLNHLAKQIERLESQGELITYKAMIQVASPITLENALDLSYQTENFTVLKDIICPVDYAKHKLSNCDIPLREELLSMSNLDGYGEKLMKHNHVINTDYGMLVSLDGITIEQCLEREETKLSMEM